MNCTNGHSVPSDSQFCPYCGVSSFAEDQPQQADASFASQSPWMPPQASDRVSEGPRELTEDRQLQGSQASREMIGTTSRAPIAGANKMPHLIGVGICAIGVAALILGSVFANRGKDSSGASASSGTGTSITVTLGLGVGCAAVPALYSDIPGSTLVLTLSSGGVYGANFSTTGSEITTSEGFGGCEFKATFADVPKTDQVYTFSTGKRGSIAATQQQLSSKGWTFYIALTR